MCRGSRYEEAAVSLRRFFVELERSEPKVIDQNNMPIYELYHDIDNILSCAIFIIQTLCPFTYLTTPSS